MSAGWFLWVAGFVVLEAYTICLLVAAVAWRLAKAGW